jgi:hypothetical protein
MEQPHRPSDVVQAAARGEAQALRMATATAISDCSILRLEKSSYVSLKAFKYGRRLEGCDSLCARLPPQVESGMLGVGHREK